MPVDQIGFWKKPKSQLRRDPLIIFSRGKAHRGIVIFPNVGIGQACRKIKVIVVQLGMPGSGMSWVLEFKGLVVKEFS